MGLILIFFFFTRWLLIGTLGRRPTGPLPYPFHLNLYGAIKQCSPLTEAHNTAVSPLLLDPDPSWQSRRSAFLSFPTPGIYIERVLTFPSLYHISSMRNSLLSSSCAAYNANLYAQLGALPTFCNVSCPIYL